MSFLAVSSAERAPVAASARPCAESERGLTRSTKGASSTLACNRSPVCGMRSSALPCSVGWTSYESEPRLYPRVTGPAIRMAAYMQPIVTTTVRARAASRLIARHPTE